MHGRLARLLNDFAWDRVDRVFVSSHTICGIMNAVVPDLAQPVTVHALNDADIRRWDAFVTACPEATFFHRAGWRAVITRSFGHRTHYIFAERGRRDCWRTAACRRSRACCSGMH